MIALKCPICGEPLPPPVRKGGRARKYCSHRCTQAAMRKRWKYSGYHHPKNHRHVCPVCGDTFYSSRADSHCCSISCGRAYATLKKHGSDVTKLGKKSLARLEKSEEKRRAAEACRETAPVTVVERGGVRIETRGRVPCGSFCPRFVGRN